MKSFVTILAANATSSAAPKAAATVQAAPAAAPANAVPTWVEPPAKADAACRDAAWPYRATACAAKDNRTGAEAPARRVRVIPTGAAPATLALR